MLPYFFLRFFGFLNSLMKNCREVGLKYCVSVARAYSFFGREWWCANGSILVLRIPIIVLTLTLIPAPVPIPNKVSFVFFFLSIFYVYYCVVLCSIWSLLFVRSWILRFANSAVWFCVVEIGDWPRQSRLNDAKGSQVDINGIRIVCCSI